MKLEKQISGCLLLCVLFLMSCSEERKVITPIVPGGDRIILLEEFTGKGCSNCPKGSRELENLLSLYGENLVVVSIHAGFFANPTFFNIGTYDLRTDEGEALFDYLGPNSGYPAGVVNRTAFNNELQLTASAWAGFIGNEIENEPVVEFSIGKTFDPATGSLSVSISGRAKTSISGDLRISIMLTENDIIDAQDDIDAGGIIDDYKHKHVLRGMLTKFDGESFTDQLSTGESINLQFSGTLKPEWVTSNMDIVAFISNVSSSPNTFSVLQAGKLHLID
jgi:thiol-disulfide isomerase/thioredoxin